MSESDIAEEVTQLMPVTSVDENATMRVATPTVSGYMQHGYDIRLAALLAQLLGITAEELVKRTQEASHAPTS